MKNVTLNTTEATSEILAEEWLINHLDGFSIDPLSLYTTDDSKLDQIFNKLTNQELNII